jgi:tripartite-type tricarboxylate transporter receptor subunit TctC
VDFQVGPVGSALPFLRSGRLRALAVTSRERLPTLPGTATGVESGLPEWVIEPWLGIAMPQTTADQLVDVVAEALRRAMAQPEMVAQMQLLAGVPDFTAAAEFAAQIARELAVERAIVKRTRPDPAR